MMRRPDGQEIEVWQYQYPPEEIELHRAAVHDRKTISPSSISWGLQGALTEPQHATPELIA
jgi:hypothetical protein